MTPLCIAEVIAERTGTSQYYVTYVLLGHYRPDLKIIRACIDYLKEYREELEEKQKVTSEIEALRRALPYGSRKIIAERTGRPLLYVSRVLTGIYQPNKEVIKAANEYLKETSGRKGFVDRVIEMVKNIGR